MESIEFWAKIMTSCAIACILLVFLWYKELRKFSGLFKRHRKFVIGGLSVLLAVSLLISGLELYVLPLNSTIGQDNKVLTISTIGEKQIVLTIGTAHAGVSDNTDYVCNGVNDSTTFQTALNALPSTGGKLEVLGGHYYFTATVSRACDNITIAGVGMATYFSNDGATAIFSAGAQSNWVFKDFSTDAGGVNVTNAVRYRLDNLIIGTTYYPTSVRTATYVVAASNAPAHVKAQADYVCDGIADDVQIQAAIVAAGNYGSVKCIGATWNTTTAIVANATGLTLDIEGVITPSGAINAIEMSANNMNIKVNTIDGTDNTPSGIVNKSARFCTVRFEKIHRLNYGILVGDAATEALTADNSWYGEEVRDNLYGIVLAGYSVPYHAEGQTMLINFVVNSAVAPTQMVWAKQNCGFTLYMGSIDNLYPESTVKELKDDGGGSTWNIGYYTSLNDITLGYDSIFISPKSGVIGKAIATVTIADGAITVTRGVNSVETEGAAATDDLDNINGGISGQRLILRLQDGARLVTIRHKAGGTGNIRLENNRDFTLRETSSSVTFLLIDTAWIEIARSYAGNLVYQNSGTASITAGLWGVAVTHGLATTPTRVQLTFSNNCTANIYYTGAGAATFSANLTALQGSNVTFDWRAWIGEG